MGQRRTAGDVRPHGGSQQGIRQGGGKADGNEPERKPGPELDQVEEEQETERRHMHGVEKKTLDHSAPCGHVRLRHARRAQCGLIR